MARITGLWANNMSQINCPLCSKEAVTQAAQTSVHAVCRECQAELERLVPWPSSAVDIAELRQWYPCLPRRDNTCGSQQEN